MFTQAEYEELLRLYVDLGGKDNSDAMYQEVSIYFRSIKCHTITTPYLNLDYFSIFFFFFHLGGLGREYIAVPMWSMYNQQ